MSREPTRPPERVCLGCHTTEDALRRKGTLIRDVPGTWLLPPSTKPLPSVASGVVVDCACRPCIRKNERSIEAAALEAQAAADRTEAALAEARAQKRTRAQHAAPAPPPAAPIPTMLQRVLDKLRTRTQKQKHDVDAALTAGQVDVLTAELAAQGITTRSGLELGQLRREDLAREPYSTV